MSEHSGGKSLKRAQERFRTWTLEEALPVWAEQGRDEPGFGFHEHLTLAGRPAGVAFKRTRVQARQIYVFSHAQLLGAYPGLAPATDSYRFITRHGLRGDGAWVRTIGRRGGVVDPAADLYDLAFVLFALAWYSRASGEAEPLRLARRTAEFIRSTMAAPGGGYHNVVPVEPGHRQQNPHMHLLEATLALYAVTGDALYAEMASELLDLFRTRLHHGQTGTLGEFFDDALEPAAGEAGDHIEPGHHYEWVWLLDQYANLFDCALPEEAERLYHFAERHGRRQADPGILDVVARDGTVRKSSVRVWPQTEALKAHAAMARRGRDTAGRITDGIGHLHERHLDPAPRGMWHEHFGPDGTLLVDNIPSSSFYHIFMAFSEVAALLQPGALAGLRTPPQPKDAGNAATSA
jgi:mannose-6-phosphate isomerase